MKKPGEGATFTDERFCKYLERDVVYNTCWACWNGRLKKLPPGGFNRIGCQAAHLVPSPLDGARYGAVGETEERS